MRVNKLRLGVAVRRDRLCRAHGNRWIRCVHRTARWDEDFGASGDGLEPDRGEHCPFGVAVADEVPDRGLVYMAYVQAAEYNAVMAISGRYAPYGRR